MTTVAAHRAVVIRPAIPADLPLLPELERTANACFADVGMTAVAELEPSAADDFAKYADRHLVLVAVVAGEIVGFLMLRVVDGFGHVDQVSVGPDLRGHGIGARLLDAAAARASSAGLRALSLTTFEQVPWNAPYYARLGFRVLGDADLTPGLRVIRDANTHGALARWPRVTMIRECPPSERHGERP